MRTKLALMFAVLVGLGSARADVVFSNNVASNTATTSSLYIQLVTTGSGAFQLSSLTFLGGFEATNSVDYMLTANDTTAINGISGSAIIGSDGVLTFAGAGLNSFGAGTSWLKVTNLNADWDQGDNATLTKTGAGNITSGLITTGTNSTLASSTTLFGLSLVVAVPEPATLILTGSALAAGAVGAFFKRRRKILTEVAA